MSQKSLKNFFKKKKCILSSEKGFLTMDYIFAFVLVGGFFGILFAFSLTLSVAEIAQYITYSAARSYMASHKTRADQERLAEGKFNLLKQNAVLKGIFSSGWFGMKKPDIGHISSVRFSNSITNPNRDLFWGVGTEFQAHVLDFRIPFYGSTSSLVQGNQGSSGFKTFIASYLGREPTWKECYKFNQERFQKIKRLDGMYRSLRRAKYAVVNDNGC